MPRRRASSTQETLQSEIDSLKNATGNTKGVIRTDYAGYFTEFCDGYENIYDYDRIKRLSLDDLHNFCRASVTENTAGKVIGNVKWYVACEVSPDDASALNIWDSAVTVLFSEASSEPIPAEIYRINQASKDSNAVVILRNDNPHKEEKKVQGVYVLYGSEVQFKQISILYADSDYVICDTNPAEGILFNGETISLYDKVIVKGDDLYDGKVIH